MACVKPDCSYMQDVTGTLLPPALKPNADISGTGVIIGFVGPAYVTFILLTLQYLIGEHSDTTLDGPANPVDQRFLALFWRALTSLWVVREWAPLRKLLPPLRRTSGRYKEFLTNAILSMSDAQIVTGLSILIGGYSQVNCGISIFHWHMVVRLAWFSSVTHLTTLTFLRRYMYNNRGTRIIRLLLMLTLMLMLVVALILTGGECGLQNYERNRGLLDNYGEVYPGSPAKCCFKAVYGEAKFMGSKTSEFLSLITSEVMLITGSITRGLKLFSGSSTFSRRWLRHKPAQMCKRVAGKLEERYYNSNSKVARGMCITSHYAIMVLINNARAVYDYVDSVFFEITWLFLVLTYGALQLFHEKKIADTDSAAIHDTQRDVVPQENLWGFGQLILTLMLILPLLSLVEGVIGIVGSRSTNCGDDTAAATDESLLSNISPEAEPPGGRRPSLDQYAELDIATNADVVRLRRTGTASSLGNMENNIGSNTENLVDRRHFDPSSERPLQSRTAQRGRSSMRQCSTGRAWYWMGVSYCGFLNFMLGINLLLLAADGSNTVDFLLKLSIETTTT